MADKVDSLLEKMTDELLFYQDEGIFTEKEVQKIVKTRRNQEYQLQRKDAQVTYFIDSIGFEKKLDKLKSQRKKQLSKTVKVDFRHDNAIKRRVMHLYDRACRKYRQNKILWKEYLCYLIRSNSMQKFNRVASAAVQIHPDCLDFWLIAAYAELDVKGNLFSSRNLMLQALKVNDSKPRFYTEYLKFEVIFLEMLMQRSKVLNGAH
jgi:U3 small nucleolar RNA-associated protein 6